ncbi:MAG: hypothetical protein R3C30_06555 [Hyphomonadaceae bacterium]
MRHAIIAALAAAALSTRARTNAKRPQNSTSALAFAASAIDVLTYPPWAPAASDGPRCLAAFLKRSIARMALKA